MNIDPDDPIVRATITHKLMDGSFGAQVRSGKLILVAPSGRLKRQCTKVTLGDSVMVRLSEPDFTTGFVISVL